MLGDQPIPSVADAISGLHISSDSYITDDTYANHPSLLLGKVAEVDQVNGSCDQASTNPDPIWAGKLEGLTLDEPSKPALRQSILVNRALAASVSLLSYLSAGLSDSSVFSLLVNDEDVQRVDDTQPTYATAVSNWKAANQILINDPKVCWLLQVDGIAFKSIAKKKYTMANATASGGAYGVKANGSYYTSNDDYTLDYRFGLSFTIIKRPMTPSAPSILTISEQTLFGKIQRIRDKPM